MVEELRIPEKDDFAGNGADIPAVAFDSDPLYSPGERAVARVRGLSGGVSVRCRSGSQVVENQRA